MALSTFLTINKVRWAGNTKSLGSIVVSASWASETLAILEEGSVIRAIFAGSVVLVPNLVVSADEAL